MRAVRRATLPAAVTTGCGVTGFTALTACAWLALVVVQRSEHAWFFSHEVLGARGVAVPLAVGGFATGWTLMTVAMMTPGALPALARVLWAPSAAASQRHARGRRGIAWLAGNLSPWLCLGFAFAAFDLVVHAIIEPALPLLVARAPALLWFAAGMQMLWPWRGVHARRVRTRHADTRHADTRRAPLTSAFLGGWRAGLRCLRGGWLLMLAVASGGHTSLLTMAAATLLMAAPAYGWVPRWTYGAGGCIVAFTAAVAAWPA